MSARQQLLPYFSSYLYQNTAYSDLFDNVNHILCAQYITNIGITNPCPFHCNSNLDFQIHLQVLVAMDPFINSPLSVRNVYWARKLL